MPDNESWKHIKTIADNDPYELDGLNIWDHPWRATGEVIQINDPIYGQPYQFQVYTISTNERTVEFAAGEFSNCVWGIFRKSGN